jgi:SAM-dependent methyltransferase
MMTAFATGGKVERTSCNLCGSSRARLLFVSEDYRYGVDAERYGVWRCRDCGLGYLSPRPTREAIQRYYPSGYHSGRDELPRLVAQMRYLEDVAPGRLLDVGAADGDFLDLAAQRGWQVVGVEPFSSRSLERGFKTVADIEDPALEPGSFDAVTAWSVLEHLHDPAAAFARIHELLRPGGRLVIHVPNLRSVMSRWSYREDVPRHLHFFTGATLRAYGDRYGLPLVRVEHDTAIMDGSGHGFLKLHLWRLLGRNIRSFFDWERLPRAERRRTRPAFFVFSVPIGMAERVVLAERVRRWLHVNGFIVAVFERPL